MLFVVHGNKFAAYIYAYRAQRVKESEVDQYLTINEAINSRLLQLIGSQALLLVPHNKTWFTITLCQIIGTSITSLIYVVTVVTSTSIPSPRRS